MILKFRDFEIRNQERRFSIARLPTSLSILRPVYSAGLQYLSFMREKEPSWVIAVSKMPVPDSEGLEELS